MPVLLALLAFVVRPLWAPVDLRSIADKAHGFTVFVVARSSGAQTSSSGVLIRGGLVLTDLHGLLDRKADGSLVEAEIVVVLDGLGAVPARLSGADVALGIAVLQLPDEARKLPGADIATADPAIADQLLAMGTDGKVVDVLGVRIDHVGLPLLHTSATLPDSFRGGPLFDASGHLAALELPAGAAAASSVLRLLEQK